MDAAAPMHRSASPISMVKTDDGCALAVRELRAAASESAPVVMLVHALAMDGSMWQRVADALREPARVLAIDCRGHGQSAKPPGPYSTQRFARDVRQAADALGVDSMLLGGCSMGGLVAQAFAGAWPERLHGLLLVDTTAWYGANAAAAWAARATQALEKGFASLLEFQRERWFSPEFLAAHPELLAEAVGIFERNDAQAYANTCRMLGAADERDEIAKYKGPAAVFVGEHDHATPPAMAADLAARIPGARLTVMPAARHFTPYEAPVAIAGEIDALLSSRRTGRPAKTTEETP
jgi:3-oxoadipate enol-lactonase